MRGVEEAPGAVASSSPALLQCARRQEATTAMTESEAAQHLQTKPAQECPGGPQTPDWALHSVQLEAAPGRTGTFYGTVTIDDQRLTVRIQDGLLSLEAREPSGGSSASDLQNLCDAGLDQLVLVSCESEPRKSGASHVLLGDPTSGDTTGVPTVAPQQDVDSMCSTVEDGIAHGQLANIFIDENGEVRLAADGFGRKGLVLVFNCPQADCRKTFDKKHKLKLHLLTQHTSEEQRPFRCSVEGCSWSFTTAYKLKRHLQSHGNLRPYTCPLEGCGKTFTTVYNLKAHGKTHELGDTFKCEVCEERFPSLAKLTSHRKMHFEPNKPYVCEFPGCEKMFTTVSALFSHNRAHFREIEQFTCSFPGCNKQYDKACRLKIHLRSHTGERPFICDFDGCGWSFTSMSKLLRHNRKHADDRRFTCHIEGCGKSFTRAEHLKGHSIIHLGTKPFECPVEGCCAKFSARSSLYIHSKKHLQDVTSLKAPCPVSSCHKAFTSKHSMKTHMVKQHNFSQDLLTQLEATSSLTPSSELSGAGLNDQNNLDLASLFSSASSNSPGIGTDMALVNSGILTIDAASVGSTLGGNLAVVNHSLGQPIDPLLLVAGSDMPNSLDTSLLLGAATSVLQQSTLNLDDVQTVSAEALGSMASLSMQSSSQDLHGLTVDTRTLLPSSSLGGSNTVPELLTTVKVEGNLLDGLDVAAQQEGNKVVTQFVFPNPTGSYSAQKEMDLSSVTGSSFLVCNNYI